MLAVCEPLVPVTIRLAVVGGFTIGGGGVLLAEPPQAVRPPMTNSAINASTACLRFFRREAIPINTPPNTSNIVLRNGTGIDRAFCVPETVIVIGTLEDDASKSIEAGFTEQVVPAGAPAQLSATVPMKP